MTRRQRYTVSVGGKRLESVQSLQLRFAVSELADSFSMQVADRLLLDGGEAVEIAIEGRVVLVGHVQSCRLAKRAGTRDLTITGYSAAQQLVKSSIVDTRRVYTDTTLRQLVERVCKPFGLLVEVESSATAVANEVLDQIAVDNGEKAFDFLAKACKRQACVLVSGAATVADDKPAKAAVTITRVGVRMAPVVIVYPSPRVLGVDYETDIRDVHSHYYVTRRGRGVLGTDGTLKGLDGVARDERVPYSPLIIKAEKGGKSQTALDHQAEQEMRRRAAEGRRFSVEVDGWSPNDSQALWWPNTMFRFVDVEEGIDDILVVSSVEIAVDQQGTRAKLDLMPPDAHAILHKRVISKGSGGKYRTNREWLKQHAELVAAIAEASSTVDFQRESLELIWTPEDPSA